jgi:TPR repeat protein
MYLNGLGVEQNATQAVSWYRRAADQGDSVAQYNLGTHYRVGEGLPLDLNEAVRWLTLSAEQGYPDAMNDLGVAYRFGNGIQRDIFKAARLFVMAADADDVVALGNLTEMSQELEALARNGDPMAQFHIGLLLARGYGVPKDRPLADAWLKLAVEGFTDEEEMAQIRDVLADFHEELSSAELKRAGAELAKLQKDSANTSAAS